MTHYVFQLISIRILIHILFKYKYEYKYISQMLHVTFSIKFKYLFYKHLNVSIQLLLNFILDVL